VYSIFSALIMHVYQMRSSVPSIAQASQRRMQICMDALNEVSRVWLVAKMVHTLFISILGNKNMEERLQKAAGKRHKKAKLDSHHQQSQLNHQHQSHNPDSPAKLQFGEMTLGYPTGPPAPTVSFERSRPQTPALASPPNTDTTMGNTNMISPNLREGEGFGVGNSRGNTRPTTPFNNTSYSIPATPPDMFLVTRNSPTISQSLWENFQPGLLFPESTNVDFSTQFGSVDTANLDPALQMPGMQSTAGLGNTVPQHDVGGQPAQNIQMGGMPQDNWTTPLSPEDTWSNSSRSAVPMALNVEDW